MKPPVRIHRLGSRDISDMRALLALFGRAFEEPATYEAVQPDDAYLTSLLDDPGVIVLVAFADTEIVAGLVAYELKKFEQARSEIYIYDLAVEVGYRRQGIATALITHLKPIAKAMGAWTIFVQADKGDAPATAFYSKLGKREEVLHSIRQNASGVQTDIPSYQSYCLAKIPLALRDFLLCEDYYEYKIELLFFITLMLKWLLQILDREVNQRAVGTPNSHYR